MSYRPLTEQAIVSALQAMAANPDYSDFMRTMEQQCPGLRTITLPQITKLNIPANSPCSSASIPHANPPIDHPGHSHHGASEPSRSPSCASTSSQKGGGKRRSASRKRSSARSLASVTTKCKQPLKQTAT